MSTPLSGLLTSTGTTAMHCYHFVVAYVWHRDSLLWLFSSHGSVRIWLAVFGDMPLHQTFEASSLPLKRRFQSISAVFGDMPLHRTFEASSLPLKRRFQSISTHMKKHWNVVCHRFWLNFVKIKYLGPKHMCQVFRSLGLLVSMVAGSNGIAPFRRCETRHIDHF